MSTASQRLLLSDFDGTLVGHDLIISERVRKAVKAWQAAGNIFSIITGRTYSGVLENTCTQLQISHLIVTRGGSEFWNPQTKELVSSVTMDEESVKKIITVLTKHNIYFEVGKGDAVYAAEHEGISKDPWKKYLPLEELIPTHVSKIRTILAPGETIDVDTIIHEEIIKALPEVHAIKAPNKFTIGYDITSQKATKYIAALELMKEFGFDELQTIGIGDSYNDYPLLSAAGVKIAMGNAPDELLEIATMVVPTVEEDGVAVAIESLLQR